MAGNPLIVGLDIGTTKICAIVGEKNPDGHLDVIGVGTHPSHGLRKGVVINIETTVESIKAAVEQAEQQAGIDINSVYVGIAGGHIKSFNSTGVVGVKGGEVTDADVKRVIEGAKAVAIPMDREVIHVIPQEFIIDNQGGIKEPVGMSGVRLESRVHIVTGAISAAQNLVKCVNKAGLNVSDIILQPIASARACLTKDEMDLGVVLVDIGGGTVDIAIFVQGSLVYTTVIALGGNNFTHDISIGLRTPQQEAENLKIRYGSAKVDSVPIDDTIDVKVVGGKKSRMMPRRVLAQIIEPRTEEIMSLVRREIIKSGYEELISAGAVLTGGASLLSGIEDVAEDILQMPVKLSAPNQVKGLIDIVSSPKFSTGVGLVLIGSEDTKNTSKNRARFPIRGDDDVFSQVKNSFSNWLKELF